MPQYMISYLGGNSPASPEEGKLHFQKYKAWLSSLGDASVSPANPIKGTCTVKPDGRLKREGLQLCHGLPLLKLTQ